MFNKLLFLFLIISAFSSCNGTLFPNVITTLPKVKKRIITVDATSGIANEEYLRVGGEIKTICKNIETEDQLILLPIANEPWESLGSKLQRIGISTSQLGADPYKEKIKAERTKAINQVEIFFSALSKDTQSRMRVNRSSILEAIKACAKEINEPSDELIICSDMVEHSEELKFLSSNEMINPIAAERLAKRLSANNELFQGNLIRIVMLKSVDTEKMSSLRRSAVQKFWEAYLIGSGASKVDIRISLSGI